MINSIIDSIRECQLQSGVGYSFNRGAGGTTLTIKQPRSAVAVATSTACAFDVTYTLVTASLYDVSFEVGLINGILPINIFDVMTNVTTSNRTYYYLNCQTDGKLITECEIQRSTEIRTPSASTVDVAPDEFDIMIATVSTYGLIEKTIPCGNVIARISLNIQEDNTEFVVGERNYKQYYNWIF